MKSIFWKRLSFLFRREQLEQDLTEEMQFHLEKKIEENLAAGMTEEEAKLQAQRDFGNPVSLKERAREPWAFPMEDLILDIKYGFRILRRRPAYTLAAFLTLMFAIAVNTAMFSVLNAVLLRPLPYPDSSRLVRVWINGADSSTSKAVFVQFRKNASSIEGAAAYTGWYLPMTGHGEPVILEGARVTSEFLSLLGARTELGRTFLANEDQPGKSDVVVLTHGSWQRRFGSDPAILQRSLVLGGKPFQVIGVLTPDFRMPDRQFRMEECEFILPAPLDPADDDDFTAGYLSIVARLKPDVTVEQARAESITKARGYRKTLPRATEKFGEDVLVIPLQRHIAGDSRSTIHLMFAAVLLVLLAACASVANLQLSRTAERRREIAVRSALGAGRNRVIRQILTESALLASIGGTAGILLAAWGLKFLEILLPRGISRVAAYSIDFTVLLFSIGLIFLASAISGLASVWQLAKRDLQEGLKSEGRGIIRGDGRLRRVLVTSEVSLALVLLIGSGLLIKSLWELNKVDPGFDAEGVLSLRLSLAGDAYNEDVRKHQFYREVLSKIRQLPGVESAGAIHLLPMGDSNWNTGFQVEEFVVPEDEQSSLDWRVVTSSYFDTMRIRLIRGRYFNERDGAGSPPVAIVNETLARRYWPNQDPLGKRIRSGFERKVWVPIVGVVADVKEQGIDLDTHMELYRPYEQASYPASLTVMVRSKSTLETLIPSIRKQVWSVDKNVPVASIQPLTKVLSHSMAPRRSIMLLISMFAGIALLLSVVGVYGVVACFVNQSIPAIGIRIALGASNRAIRNMVLMEAAIPAIAGIVIGCGAAYALSRLISQLLFAVKPNDPIVYAIVAILLFAMALAAAMLPARKATRVDVLQTLRND